MSNDGSFPSGWQIFWCELQTLIIVILAVVVTVILVLLGTISVTFFFVTKTKALKAWQTIPSPSDLGRDQHRAARPADRIRRSLRPRDRAEGHSSGPANGRGGKSVDPGQCSDHGAAIRRGR